MSAQEATTDEQVIVGKLDINLVSPRVLFDYEALHSFIHEGFVWENGFQIREVNHSFKWFVAPEITHETKWVVNKTKLEIVGMDFQADMVMLKSGDLDAIFGMN